MKGTFKLQWSKCATRGAVVECGDAPLDRVFQLVQCVMRKLGSDRPPEDAGLFFEILAEDAPVRLYEGRLEMQMVRCLHRAWHDTRIYISPSEQCERQYTDDAFVKMRRAIEQALQQVPL